MNVGPRGPELPPGDGTAAAPSRLTPRPRPLAGQAAAGRPDPGGEVQLSGRALELLSLTPRLQALAGPAREGRIAELRALVAAGRYGVDGEAIAGAMLGDPAVAALLTAPL